MRREPLFFYCPYCPSPFNCFDTAEECKAHIKSKHPDPDDSKILGGGQAARPVAPPADNTVPWAAIDGDFLQTAAGVTTAPGINGRATCYSGNTSHFEVSSNATPRRGDDLLRPHVVSERPPVGRHLPYPSGKMEPVNAGRKKTASPKTFYCQALFMLILFICVSMFAMSRLLPSVKDPEQPLQLSSEVRKPLQTQKSGLRGSPTICEDKPFCSGLNEACCPGGKGNAGCGNSDCTLRPDNKTYDCPGTWMRENCPQKCGLCCRDKAPGTQCADSVDCCPGSAGGSRCSTGDCWHSAEHNKYICIGTWMKMNCAKTCGLCDSCKKDDMSQCKTSKDCCPGGKGGTQCGGMDCHINGDGHTWTCPGQWMKTSCLHECNLCDGV